MLFESIVQEAPNLASAHYFKGVSHLGKGEVQAAKAAFSRTIELTPNSVKTRLLLANIHLRLRDADLARAESQEILRLEPNNYQATLIQGNAELILGNIQQAETSYAKLIALNDSNPTGYYRLGVIAQIKKDYDRAIEYYQKALSLNPKLMDVSTELVRAHMGRGDFEQALAQCDQQLTVTEEIPQLTAVIHFLKGSIYASRQDLENSQAEYEKAITTYSNYLPPYYALAGLYLRQNKEDEAIAQYSAITEKAPQQTRPHMMLGAIYENQQNIDLAEKHYRKVIEINPDFAPAANNLAYILVSQDRDINEALMLAKKAKESLPEDPSVMDTLGWIYYKKGLYDSAIVEFSDSLEKLPNNATIHYHLGAAFYKKGELENAKVQLEKAISLDPKFEGSDDAREILKTL